MVTPINKRVQQPRDTTVVNDQYVGPIGQITVDFQRWELRLHDGRTPGGKRIPNITQLLQLFVATDSEFGQVSFSPELTGFLARVTDRGYQTRSILGGNGITVDNPDGAAGDPKIGLPGRLDESQLYLTDADPIIETGFYIVQKGSNGLPADLKTNFDVQLIVIGFNDGTTSFITQIAVGAQDTTGAIYVRRRITNVWQVWSPASGIVGTAVVLNKLTDQTPRSWSAYDLAELIRQSVSSIQYVDPSNVGKAFNMNELFAIPGTGADVSQVIRGPFNMATGDRFELVASATAKASNVGETQIAKVEVETGAGYQLVATMNVTSIANGPAVTDSVIGRLVKTAAGFDIVDSTWLTVSSSIAGAATGNFRVTIGADSKAGARGTRWR